MADFILSNEALKDLSDIWCYTIDKWSENQADSYYNMLIETCTKLSKNPTLYGFSYEEILKGLRGYKAGKHILFYLILANGKIEIVRILHERMDLPNKLNK